jgi:hypothetical protein
VLTSREYENFNNILFHRKNIKINPGTREVGAQVKSQPSSNNVNTTRVKTPFGMVKPVVKKEIKQEPPQEPVVLMDVSEEDIVNPIKKETSSSQGSQNTKSKTAAKKEAKPVAKNKASISSFFGNSDAKHALRIVKTAEMKIEEPTMNIKKEEPTKERSASPQKTTKEPPKKRAASNKLKLKDVPNKKRSRIQVVDDSSDEEPEKQEPAKEPESKFLKFDRESTPELEETASDSPIKEELPERGPEIARGVKNKAKRWVTKRFETDDGFVRTQKVLEEYSASEDENDENRKKNSPPQEKKLPSPSADKVSPQKRSAKSKPKDVNVKQGSIMSFFSKK